MIQAFLVNIIYDMLIVVIYRKGFLRTIGCEGSVRNGYILYKKKLVLSKGSKTLG